jgi:hypothetical protein
MKLRSPAICLIPTAFQAKPDISAKHPESREFSEMEFPKTAKILEMDFPEYNTETRVEMDISNTIHKSVIWGMATDVVLMAVLMMGFKRAIILCPTLTSSRSLPARRFVR